MVYVCGIPFLPYNLFPFQINIIPPPKKKKKTGCHLKQMQPSSEEENRITDTSEHPRKLINIFLTNICRSRFAWWRHFTIAAAATTTTNTSTTTTATSTPTLTPTPTPTTSATVTATTTTTTTTMATTTTTTITTINTTTTTTTRNLQGIAFFCTWTAFLEKKFKTVIVIVIIVV